MYCLKQLGKNVYCFWQIEMLLVSQAKNNFSEYLPDLSSIDLTQEKENDTTRLVFSTYPSMMNKNRQHSLRNADERFYGVGHFDLIIVDGKRTGQYNRYKAIFDYFDVAIGVD